MTVIIADKKFLCIKVVVESITRNTAVGKKVGRFCQCCAKLVGSNVYSSFDSFSADEAASPSIDFTYFKTSFVRKIAEVMIVSQKCFFIQEVCNENGLETVV